MTTWSDVLNEHCHRLAGDQSPGLATNIHAAVNIAHRAAATIQELDGWGERPGFRDAAFRLNLAEAELRDALAHQRRRAQPVPLPAVVAGEADAVVAGLITMLAGAYRALLVALEPGGQMEGDLPSARAAIEIDEARRSLCARPRA
jgi:hypothetical protein